MFLETILYSLSTFQCKGAVSLWQFFGELDVAGTAAAICLLSKFPNQDMGVSPQRGCSLHDG